MGEDTWLVIDDDLSQCASDSDAIDSETEAELYSTIHYEENIDSQFSKLVKFQNIELNSSCPADFFTSQENICTQKKKQTDHLLDNEISSHKNASLHKFNQESNPSKKSKTDFTSSNNLNSDDLENDSHQLRKNIKNVTQCSSSMKQNPQKWDSTIVFDSTDSDDSNIWKEVDSLEKSDFTINLSKDDIDAIYVTSSDSDSELPSSSSHTFRKRESVLKNLSMPNIKVGETYEGEWHINSEDLYRSKKYSRRYHTNSELSCSNCNGKGHNFKNCQEPKVLKCFICGGTHLGFRCPNRICGTCFRYGHDRMQCQMGPNSFYCELCLMSGHIKQNCPDLWRRYHLTTNSDKIVRGRKVKDGSNLYCWNCGKTGHFGGVCQNRFARNSVNTWPCVISYDDPREVFRNKRLFQEKNLEDWRIGHNFCSNEGSVSFTEWKKQRKEKRDNKRRQKYREKKALKKAAKKGPNQEVQERQKCQQRISIIQKRIKKIVKERNFPRAPKKILPQQCDETPRSLEILKKRKLRRQRLKLKRQLKRQQLLNSETPVKVENN